MLRLSSLTQLIVAFVILGGHPAAAVKTYDGHGQGFMEVRHRAQPPRAYAVTKLRSIPHENSPWTQGLEMGSADGTLVESVGGYPDPLNSYVRIVDTSDGKTVMATPKTSVFLEGIVRLGDSWYASTYNDNKALEYDHLLNIVQEHSYSFEGWGLVRSAAGDSFMATNGSSSLFSLDRNFRPLGDFEKTVTCLGKPVAGLNELEFVENFGGHGNAVLGNVINSRIVLAIDPETAACTGVFDLRGLEAEQAGEGLGFHVANGIAHDSKTGNFWVTGKNWKEMFEVRLEEKEPEQGDALSLLQAHLNGPMSSAALLQVPIGSE